MQKSLVKELFSIYLIFFWNDTFCHVRASLDYSKTTGVPKSVIQEYPQKDGVKLWNPSSQIDEDGFLSKTYRRLPSELEVGRDAIEGIHHKSKLETNPVRCRQVPGDGNCLFHSLVVCLNWVEEGKHYCYKDYDALRRLSLQLREKAVDYLSSKPKRKLYLQGDEYIRADELVKAAAAPFNVSPEKYCETMRQESYWGGGPEIAALCNLLRRPIHVYELYSHGKQEFCFRRMAYLGSPRFDRKEALHILSADSRFPDVTPGKQAAMGSHFLALFPHVVTRKRKQMIARGGGKSVTSFVKYIPRVFDISKTNSLHGLLSSWFKTLAGINRSNNG